MTHTAIPDWVSLITWLFSELQTCLNSSWALCSSGLGTVGCAPAFPESHTLGGAYQSQMTGSSSPGTSWEGCQEVPDWSFQVSSVALRNLSAGDVTPRLLGCSPGLTGFTILAFSTLFTSEWGVCMRSSGAAVCRLVEPDQKQLSTCQASQDFLKLFRGVLGIIFRN